MQAKQANPDEIGRDQWSEFLTDFGRRNEKKPTRLEAASPEFGSQIIEERLPLIGVTFESKGSEAGSVEIILGGESADGPRQMEHLVMETKRITLLVGSQGVEDGLAFESEDGTRTLLTFEEFRELPSE